MLNYYSYLNVEENNTVLCASSRVFYTLCVFTSRHQTDDLQTHLATRPPGHRRAGVQLAGARGANSTPVLSPLRGRRGRAESGLG